VAVNINNRQHRITVAHEILTDLDKMAALALQQHRLPGAAEIDVTFCDDDFVRKLNREWRNQDTATDVLSFPQLDSVDAIAPGADEVLLGDIVISLERAQDQAEEFGHSFSREVSYLFVHGLLHLLGYNHQSEREKEEMRLAEENLLAMVRADR